MDWKIIAQPNEDGSIAVRIEAADEESYEAGYAAWLRLSSAAFDSPVADAVVVELKLINGSPCRGTFTARELAAFLAESARAVRQLR